MATHAHSTLAPEDGAHRFTRRALSAAIEAAIAVLDELDPDPDLEDGDADEDDDPAEDADVGEDGGDREPSLGSPEHPPTGWGAVYGPTVDYRSDQTRWADGSRSDREEDAGDEGEPDEDGEHALGWSANVGQLDLGQNTADGDETALESHGAGFLRSGGDDSEDNHDHEPVDEDGDADGVADDSTSKVPL